MTRSTLWRFFRRWMLVTGALLLGGRCPCCGQPGCGTGLGMATALGGLLTGVGTIIRHFWNRVKPGRSTRLSPCGLPREFETLPEGHTKESSPAHDQPNSFFSEQAGDACQLESKPHARAGAPGAQMIVGMVLSVATLLALAGCGRPEGPPTKPIVVVSVPPQAFFAEQVAGDLVSVQVMIPPGASPATYEPTMNQTTELSKAVLYVKVGHPNFPFERAWLDRILTQSAGFKVVDGSSGIARLEGDPHVWVSPDCVRTMATNLHRAMMEILPEHKVELDGRLQKFMQAIDAVDADIRETLKDQRGGKFFVFHPAWEYFARYYGLEQIAIEQGAKEPTPAQLAALIDQARREGVKVIFVQPQFSRASAELVAAEIGGRVVAVDPLERQWLENMRRVARAFKEALHP